MRAGFTLIETILYVALAGAVSVVLIQSIALLQDIRTRHVVAAEVNDQVSWVLSSIADRIEKGGVVVPGPGDAGTILSFEDGWSITVNDGQFIQSTATRSLMLSGKDILVSSVSFSNLGSSAGDIIRIGLTAAFRSGASAASAFQYQRDYETSITPFR